jgi:hypothetical protein
MHSRSIQTVVTTPAVLAWWNDSTTVNTGRRVSAAHVQFRTDVIPDQFGVVLPSESLQNDPDNIESRIRIRWSFLDRGNRI